jgi:hypothetical protein
MVLVREEDLGFVGLEALVLLGVLDVEKKEGDYLVFLVHLCDASVGAKENLWMCILASCASLVEQPALVGSDS